MVEFLFVHLSLVKFPESDSTIIKVKGQQNHQKDRIVTVELYVNRAKSYKYTHTEDSSVKRTGENESYSFYKHLYAGLR